MKKSEIKTIRKYYKYYQLAIDTTWIELERTTDRSLKKELRSDIVFYKHVLSMLDDLIHDLNISENKYGL